MFWDGELCNSHLDIVIDSLIAAAVVLAYALQWHRIKTSSTVQGLSPYFVLFSVLFANVQLSYNLFFIAYGYPNSSQPVLDSISAGRLKGSRAFGALFGHIHICLCWTGVIAWIMVYGDDESSVRQPSHGPSGKTIGKLAFAHAAAVVFAILPVTVPNRGEMNFAKGIVVSSISFLDMFGGPIVLIALVYSQDRERKRQHGDPGALSLASLALQMVIMLAVATRWFIRLGPLPKDDPRHPVVAYELNYYPWGLNAINYVAYALGCAFLLVRYFLTSSFGMGSAETAPLLR